MELLNKYVITLVSTIVFMSAVELIAPNNSMKKYLKFILGLILIATILNPILQFVNGKEDKLTKTIQDYQAEITSIDLGSNKESNKRVFENNFNRSLEKLLADKFNDLKFQCDSDCTLDIDNKNIDINRIVVKVKDDRALNIQKVIIGKETEGEEQDKIKEYLVDVLKVSEDKIEVKY